jgi:hypothetical protein
MSIQKKITLRYRDEGHVRFEIPDELCDAIFAEKLTANLLEVEGVYRVKLFRRQNKLSIRYHEVVCDFKQLASQLFLLISELEKQGSLDLHDTHQEKPEATPSWDVKSQVKQWRVSQWATEKYNGAKETAQAVKIMTKVGLKGPKALIKDPEKAAIDFFNDILVLYLIKLHWLRITQEWIPKPWTFRYQWTAVFYLFYLLLRSRRPKK